MGVKAIILTNAAGGIRFVQGRLVVIRDHINLQGVNPLSGFNDERFGPRFPDMTNAYDKRFREMAVGQGNRLGIGIDEGVYAALAGPSYETPAEIRYLKTIGADLVGMSTVPEVIAARAQRHARAGNFLRDQRGGGHSRSAAQSPGGSGDGGAGERRLRGAAESGAAEN